MFYKQSMSYEQDVMLTELDDYFTKVVWMSSPHEKTHIADFALVCSVASKLVFLNI